MELERREFKYRIDLATAAGVRAALQPFCEIDPHAAGSPDQRYAIDSLYFDTPSMALYRANEEELSARFKLRVRTYPGPAKAPAFLEVKGRSNDIVVKHRARVDRHRWPELLEGPASSVADPTLVRPSDRAAAERFVLLNRMHLCRPITVVRYLREPWVSTIDPYVRVTFDQAIEAQPALGTTLQTTPDRWRGHDSGYVTQTAGHSPVILELKFQALCPTWLVHIVQRFDLRRSSFSKYGTSVEAWSETPTMRAARGTRPGARGWT